MSARLTKLWLMGLSSSSTLVSNAAPFGIAYPPALSQAPSYTSQRSLSPPSGAPSFPPAPAPGAPSFPPSRSQTSLPPSRSQTGLSNPSRYPPNSYTPPDEYNPRPYGQRSSSGSNGSQQGWGRSITGLSRMTDEPESMPYMPPSQAMQVDYGYGGQNGNRRDPNAGRWGY